MTKLAWPRLASLLALTLATTLATSQVHADSNPDAAAELARAREVELQGNFRQACKAYQRASELAHGQSASSLIGLSSCYTKANERDKAVATARQALAVSASLEERTEAANALGSTLLRRADEPSRIEAASLFNEAAAGSGGIQSQRGLLIALLSLHRDQEAAEILQGLRKQGMSEDDIQQQILLEVYYPDSEHNPKLFEDVDEDQHRLDPETPWHGGGKITRPQVRTQVRPRANAKLLLRNGDFSGTVILQVTIDADGKVSRVSVLKGLPMGLSEDAVDAVKRWTFKPATRDGKPVKVWYVLTVTFGRL